MNAKLSIDFENEEIKCLEKTKEILEEIARAYAACGRRDRADEIWNIIKKLDLIQENKYFSA